MWKWLVIIGAGYLLFRLLMNDQKRKTQTSDTEQKRKFAAGEMAKDPVCGTYIEKDSSISVRDGDTLHRFCSYDCRDAFLKQLQDAGRQIPEQEDTK